LDGIPAASRGVPQIEVTFDIDVDGILSVKAREKETGVEQSVTIQGASNLNELEVEKMLEEAEKFASADKEKREKIDLKIQMEALCFEAEKELSILNENLSIEIKNTITSIIESIRQDIQNENFENLKIRGEELKNAMKPLVEVKMSQNSKTDSTSNLNDL
jgi:molecular chaperone DnaK